MVNHQTDELIVGLVICLRVSNYQYFLSWGQLIRIGSHESLEDDKLYPLIFMVCN